MHVEYDPKRLFRRAGWWWNEHSQREGNTPQAIQASWFRLIRFWYNEYDLYEEAPGRRAFWEERLRRRIIFLYLGKYPYPFPSEHCRSERWCPHMLWFLDTESGIRWMLYGDDIDRLRPANRDRF